MPKKVLIISYYWPPSGGIGVLRCLKIAKYLRQFGWEPIVYTAKDAHYPGHDESNFKDIPPGMTVLKQPIIEPYAFYKRFTGKAAEANVNNDLVAATDAGSLKHKISVFIRSNFFIPDARALWIKPSVRFLVDWLKENPVDAIFSDGPPHSNTMIACRVKQATGLPWLADFQDPWTQVDYYQRLILTPWADQKHRRLEQEALRTADRTVIVSETWKHDLAKIGGRRISVIPWGFDEDDFRGLNFAPDWKCTLTHPGLIGDDRNPEQLFAAMAELAAQVPQFKDLFRLQLMGQVAKSVENAWQKYGVGSMVQQMGQVKREEALKAVFNSQVLLLLLNKADNAQGRIPGKLFEYLASRRPVICLGPPGSDVDNILRQTQAGDAVAHADTEGIKARLLAYFRIYQSAGNIPSQTNDQIYQYTNQLLTGKIAALLDEITQPN
jgi:glycosyltransferase involved in cell wall biosynthesis